MDKAPKILPPSMCHFLSDSLGILYQCMQDCWSIFKDIVWDHPNIEESKQADKAAFKAHGEKKGLSESILTVHPSNWQLTMLLISAARTIYPNHSCCINPLCMQATKQVSIKKEQQRHIVIFTIADGACPVCSTVQVSCSL
jgi:hypothetical protein